MKLVPRDPNTQTASSPTRSGDFDPKLAAMVREAPSDPHVPSRSGINDDLDLGHAYNKALAAQAASPLPVASNVGAEDAERRRQLVDSIRVKSSSMTMVAGQSALNGMLWGGVAGTGILLIRYWLHGAGHDD
jgi:hypothetical protein